MTPRKDGMYGWMDGQHGWMLQHRNPQVLWYDTSDTNPNTTWVKRKPQLYQQHLHQLWSPAKKWVKLHDPWSRLIKGVSYNWEMHSLKLSKTRLKIGHFLQRLEVLHNKFQNKKKGTSSHPLVFTLLVSGSSLAIILLGRAIPYEAESFSDSAVWQYHHSSSLAHRCIDSSHTSTKGTHPLNLT